MDSELHGSEKQWKWRQNTSLEIIQNSKILCFCIFVIIKSTFPNDYVQGITNYFG